MFCRTSAAAAAPRLARRTAAISTIFNPPRICHQCLSGLSRTPFSTNSTRSGSATITRSIAASTSWRSPKYYFLSNVFLVKRGRSSIVEVLKPGADTLPVHRRRRRKTQPEGTDPAIPPDASSLLSTSSFAASSSLKRDALAYLSLSKPRLTALIVLTTMTSYALFPVDPLLASPAAPTLSALTLLYLTVGTTLSSAAANALNMAYEPHYDAQMSRTRNRPLVRGLLSTRQACAFAAITGTLGVAALHIGINPTVAALGALNIFLYAGVYTPMKRWSVANTWVGAIVGGIPPLMGWAAASGATAIDGTALELLSHPGGWLLAGLLFAWQFPHFNALSWTIKEEYKKAGYQMMCWKYPALNARVALRYAVLFFPLCVGLWWTGVTDVGFVVDSSVVNAWLVREAWKFYRYGGEAGRARGLFWASVWHLPLILVLAMAHKAGLWRGVWEKFMGTPEGEWEEEELEEEELEEAEKALAIPAALNS